MLLIDLLFVFYVSGVFTLCVRIGIGILEERVELNLRLILEVLAWPFYLMSKQGRKALFKIITA